MAEVGEPRADLEHAVGGTVIKDSGARTEYATGAHRDLGEGKGFFHLIPFDGLQRVAKIFEAGSKKYRANNWRLGIPLSSFVNSGIRHAIKAANGWEDEDHLAQAAWNFLCAMETQAMVKRGQLPKELLDVDDWLTNEGVARAMIIIRQDNAARKK